MTAQRRILVTGSRSWTDRETIAQGIQHALGALYTLAELRPDSFHPVAVTVVHGGARGADRLAGEVAERAGMRVEVWPADWSTGLGAGIRRNAAMVAAGAHICVAFPLGASRGTRDCMSRAERAGITVLNLGDRDEQPALEDITA